MQLIYAAAVAAFQSSFNFGTIADLSYHLPELEGHAYGCVQNEWCRKNKSIPFIEEALLSEWRWYFMF